MGLLFKMCFLFLVPNVCLAHGSLDELIHNLTSEIEKDPKNASLYLRRGEIYREHQEWLKATEDYKVARNLDPGLKDVELAEAQLNLESGHAQLAKDIVNKYLKEKKEHASARYLRARILTQLKQWPDAVSDFTFYIEHGESIQPQVFIERAEAQLKIGKRAAAEAGLDEGMAKLGPLLSLQEKAIQIEVEAKFFDRALARVDQVLKVLNRKEVWLARRGDILASAGKKAEAIQSYKLALSEIKSLPTPHQNTPTIKALRTELEVKLK